MNKVAKPIDETALKRLGGGRWQTRDERFTIEPQSGTWVVVDAEQTDDLALPLVRGPFGSLTAAKEAIAGARLSEPAVSSLAARVAEHRERPSAEEQPQPKRRKGAPSSAAPLPNEPPPPAEPPAPPEPPWIRALSPSGRKRAHALIDQLADAGVPEAEELARREIVDHDGAIVAYAVGRAITALGPGATPSAVTAILSAGEDSQLGVEWHLVDGQGRPIKIEPSGAKGRPK
jgi:hypothetical protein